MFYIQKVNLLNGCTIWYGSGTMDMKGKFPQSIWRVKRQAQPTFPQILLWPLSFLQRSQVFVWSTFIIAIIVIIKMHVTKSKHAGLPLFQVCKLDICICIQELAVFNLWWLFLFKQNVTLTSLFITIWQWKLY